MIFGQQLKTIKTRKKRGRYLPSLKQREKLDRAVKNKKLFHVLVTYYVPTYNE